MKILEGCMPTTVDAVSKILSTFGGEDGGISFANTCLLIARLDKETAEGSPSAARLIQIVEQFARLIDIANGK